jgi:uncharacterized protein (DUF983 family)
MAWTKSFRKTTIEKISFSTLVGFLAVNTLLLTRKIKEMIIRIVYLQKMQT